MRAFLSGATFAAICFGMVSPLAAQIVSPVGDVDPAAPGLQTLVINEGNSREVNLFGRDPALPGTLHTGESRFEQVDGELTGKLFEGTMLKNIAWRRDGFVLPGDLQAFNRTVKIHLRVGLGTFNDFGPGFDSNFENSFPVPGPTSVVGSYAVYQAFNLPDVRNAPPTVPAPFFVPFPFSNPYVIPSNPDATYDAFIWSLQVDDVLSGCYPLDQHGSVVAMGMSSNAGTGCVVGGNTTPMTLHVTSDMDPMVPQYTVNFDLDYAPPLQPTTMIAGVAPQNVPIPGFCTNMYVSPDVFLGMSSTNSTGFLSTKVVLPWLDYYDKQHVYFQALAPDPGQLYPVKIAGSNGVDHRIIASTPKVKSIWSHLRDSAVAPGGVLYGRGLVVTFNQ